MDNEDKITVIQVSSNNLWLKPPRVYILVLIIITILGTTFLTLKNRLSKPETIQQTEDTNASPSSQIQPAKPTKSEGGSGQKPNQSSQTLPKTQNLPKPKKQ